MAATDATSPDPPPRSWRLVARRSEQVLLDQPWSLPLERWPDDRFVSVVEGTHRHVVRFLQHGEEIFAFKELPGQTAMREYRLLRAMAEDKLPVVEAVAVVARQDLDDILVTRFLNFSLPYRHLLLNRWGPMSDDAEVADRLLDAMALLLVRLHLSGYWWGDCSLNNTLLKRDAGQLAAYVVDVETGEHHDTLTPGQRCADLEIAEMNLAGGLMDVAAELELDLDDLLDPLEVVERFRGRYHELWDELTRDELIGPDERYRVDERIRRLNEMGFHVDEVEILSDSDEEGVRLKLRTSVTDQGYHRHRLAELTGIRAEENQARTLLNDISSFRSWLEQTSAGSVPYAVAVHRWRHEVYDMVLDAVPDDLRDRLEGAEIFVGLLEHKWHESERRGHDIGLRAAVRSYLDSVLPEAPTERVITP